MSNYIVRDTAGLFDPTTGQWVGVIDGNGQEHVVVPAGSKAVSAATTSDVGLEIHDGSEARAFVTVGMEGGVPTGNFTQPSQAGSYP